MRDKGFGTLLTLVILTALPGCDNVAFGGIQVELRPPSAPAEQAGEAAEAFEPPGPEPLDLGPILYLVERAEGSAAFLLPVAALADGVYEALPDPRTSADFLERFPVARYEAGAEFTLFAQGVRAGTFVSDGAVALDTSTCFARPGVSGRVEIVPEAVTHARYLALPRSEAMEIAATGPFQVRVEDAALRSAAQAVGQRLLNEMQIPFPPSLPATRRDLQPLALSPGGPRAFAVSYVYGDNLTVGPSTPLAYSLFILAEEREAGYEPVFAWYDRFERDGKAYPRLLGAHDLLATGFPEALFEIFGENEHWLALLGARAGSYRVLYQDPCGVRLSDGGVRTFP